MATLPTNCNEISSTSFEHMPSASQRSGTSILNQIKQTLQSLIDKTTAPISKEQDSVALSPVLNLSKTENLRTKEAFTKRVSSFKPTNWMGKPLAVSTPLLAQYGWKCIGPNTAKCCSCSAILVIKLPLPNASNYLEKCLEARNNVIQSHLKICMWPSYPSSVTHVNPFLPGSIIVTDIQKDFKTRYKELVAAKDDLPHLKPEFLEKYAFDDDITLSLIKIGCEDSNFDDYYTSLSAAVIACCGWSLKRENGSLHLHCTETNRKVSIRYFFTIKKTSNVPESFSISERKRMASEDVEGTSPKRMKDNEGRPQAFHIEEQWFNPIEQHYKWSPWVTNLTPITKDEFEMVVDDKDKYTNIKQPSKEGSVGWEIVRDVVLGRNKTRSTVEVGTPKKQPTEITDTGVDVKDISEVDKQYTPPRAAVRQVQRLLRQWTSPK